MAKITRIIFASLSLFLGMFFFFFGLIKVSYLLNSEIHREMRRNFVRYSKVIPLVTTVFGYKISAKYYRLFVGYFEIISGLLLAFCPLQPIKQLINVFLIFLSFGALYTHIAIDDDLNKMIPALAFCSMLITRLILYFLLKRIDDDNTEQPINQTHESIAVVNQNNDSNPFAKSNVWRSMFSFHRWIFTNNTIIVNKCKKAFTKLDSCDAGNNDPNMMPQSTKTRNQQRKRNKPKNE